MRLGNQAETSASNQDETGESGGRIGLCDFRPQRGGLFGRFEARVADAT